MTADPRELICQVRFVQPAGEFIGTAEFTLPDGQVWHPGYFELHSVLSAHFWLSRPVADCIRDYRLNSTKLIQESHMAYMQSKYPGWPTTHTDKRFLPARSAAPAEQVDATHVNLGDLDL